MYDEDAMPVNCQHCDTIFDLPDGYGSEKWYPNTVICEDCFRLEEIEIEQDEEIETCKDQIEDAEYTINDCVERLKKVGCSVLLVTTRDKISIRFTNPDRD